MCQYTFYVTALLYGTYSNDRTMPSEFLLTNRISRALDPDSTRLFVISTCYRKVKVPQSNFSGRPHSATYVEEEHPPFFFFTLHETFFALNLHKILTFGGRILPEGTNLFDPAHKDDVLQIKKKLQDRKSASSFFFSLWPHRTDVNLIVPGS